MPAPARLGLLSLFLLVCAACTSAADTTPPPTRHGVTPPASAGSTSLGATASLATATTTAAPEQTATGTPPAGPAISPDADACTATAEQKDYFAGIALQVKWAVYCGVLPEGWYLLSSSYDLGSGGQLIVSYESPGKAHHLQLQEGAYCTQGESVCQPRVQELGPTLYGDQTGSLFTLEPGYAVYVNPGASPPSWAAATVDLDEATFVRLVAGLHRVLP